MLNVALLFVSSFVAICLLVVIRLLAWSYMLGRGKVDVFSELTDKELEGLYAERTQDKARKLVISRQITASLSPALLSFALWTLAYWVASVGAERETSLFWVMVMFTSMAFTLWRAVLAWYQAVRLVRMVRLIDILWSIIEKRHNFKF